MIYLCRLLHRNTNAKRKERKSWASHAKQNVFAQTAWAAHLITNWRWSLAPWSFMHWSSQPVNLSGAETNCADCVAAGRGKLISAEGDPGVDCSSSEQAELSLCSAAAAEGEELCILCVGDEVFCMCLLQLGSSGFSCDPRVRRWNVHVPAERETGDQCWTEFDRLLENVYWPRVRETWWHQTVSDMHHDTLEIGVFYYCYYYYGSCIRKVQRPSDN